LGRKKLAGKKKLSGGSRRPAHVHPPTTGMTRVAAASSAWAKNET
jgi:hypothetical protein